MAHQQVSIGSTMILLTILWGGAAAQSNDCTNVLVSMSPCLNYISGNSSSPPSAACCTQLGSVARSQPQCLCQVVNGGGSNLGLNIDQSQALALPKACNVQTPPPSQCKATSPSGSPGTGGGSKAVPSSGNGSSDATTIKLTVSVLFFLVFAASHVSTFSMA